VVVSLRFDTVRVFHTPGRFEVQVLVLLWLIVVGVVAAGRFLPKRASAGPLAMPIVHRRLLLPEELAVVALAALALGHILGDSVQTADFVDSAGGGLGMLCMVAGFFLIRGIVEYATHHETVWFVAAVVLANAVATGPNTLRQEPTGA
jgi:hypothetical protein